MDRFQMSESYLTSIIRYTVFIIRAPLLRVVATQSWIIFAGNTIIHGTSLLIRVNVPDAIESEF